MSKTGKKTEGGLRTRGHVKHRNDSFPPLVTVITATYNAEKNLEQCIDSVLEQNYEHVEFIIIDGGSTDATLDIIRKYDDRVAYWVSEKDQGVYDAFNKGINLAHGNWLFFLGADDHLADANVLKHFFSKPRKSTFLYGNVRWGNSGRIYDGKFCRTKFFYLNICQQAIFYHRDLFDDFGKFDLKYPILADWAFNIKAFAAKKTKPLYIDLIVTDYCIEGMSSSEMKDENFSRDLKRIFLESFGKLAFLKVKFGRFLESRFKIPAGRSKWISR